MDGLFDRDGMDDPVGAPVFVEGILLDDGASDLVGLSLMLGDPLGALLAEGCELPVGTATIVGLSLLLGELDLEGSLLG